MANRLQIDQNVIMYWACPIAQDCTGSTSRYGINREAMQNQSRSLNGRSWKDFQKNFGQRRTRTITTRNIVITRDGRWLSRKQLQRKLRYHESNEQNPFVTKQRDASMRGLVLYMYFSASIQ